MTVDHVEGMFRNVFGLSESEARRAVQGRGEPASGFDRQVHVFTTSFGMSRQAAEQAVAGRDMSVAEAKRYWNSGSSVLSESAVATSARSTSWVTQVLESAALPASSGSGRYRARIIAADVLGSSGYYSAAVLQEAAQDRVFGASLACYIDHPTVTEMSERPARSVRDLAGRLVSDAVFESGAGGGLFADVEFFPHWASIVAAMKDDVGLSIRAVAEVERGEVGGRPETIVSRITEALSVDVVTKAGAGGKLVSLLESARRAA